MTIKAKAKANPVSLVPEAPAAPAAPAAPVEATAPVEAPAVTDPTPAAADPTPVTGTSGDTDYPYTVEDLANAAGVGPLRINTLRRRGDITANTYREDGRRIIYNATALAQAQAAGGGTRGRKPGVNTTTPARTRGRKPTAAHAGSDLGSDIAAAIAKQIDKGVTTGKLEVIDAVLGFLQGLKAQIKAK